MLRKYIFGPVQKAIDARRDRIRQAIEEADKARAEARALLEEHRALIQPAGGDAEQILAEARRVADAQTGTDEGGARGGAAAAARRHGQADRGRDAPRAGADPRRGRGLTVIATSKVTGKVLTDEDHRRLIDEAIGDLDFSALEEGSRKSMAVARAHLRERALRGREGEGNARQGPAGAGGVRRRHGAVPELRRCSKIRRSTRTSESRRCARSSPTPTSSSRNFLLLTTEKGRTTSSRDRRKSSRRSLHARRGSSTSSSRPPSSSPTSGAPDPRADRGRLHRKLRATRRSTPTSSEDSSLAGRIASRRRERRSRLKTLRRQLTGTGRS